MTTEMAASRPKKRTDDFIEKKKKTREKNQQKGPK
jgi:hypothetical protein